MKQKTCYIPIFTLAIMGLATIVFALDFFVLVPAGTSVFSAAHLLYGARARVLTQWGAMFAAQVLRGELWRLLTALLLNTNLLKFAVDVIALFIVGNIVEPIIGRGRTALTFFVSGIFGNLIYLLFGQNAVGAWGGTFGFIGVSLILFFRRCAELTARASAIEWLAASVYVIILSYSSWAAAIAAVTGLASGALLGLALIRREAAPDTADGASGSEDEGILLRIKRRFTKKRGLDTAQAAAGSISNEPGGSASPEASQTLSVPVDEILKVLDAAPAEDETPEQAAMRQEQETRAKRQQQLDALLNELSQARADNN